MKQGFFTILENMPLTGSVYKMRLGGDASAVKAPGQFINIRLDVKFLRRPISVCDYSENEITILYKVLGQGTEYMTTLRPGDRLDILTGLGNGFDLSCAGEAPLLIGGGVGTPPMYRLCKDLLKAGKTVTVILGFNSREEIFYEDEFKALGAKVIVSTADGSYGVKGFVTDAMEGQDYTYYYCCGPEAMLKAVWRTGVSSGQLSFEERMGCGFGACMGCSCKTVTGYKRICKDGPVLRKEELLWAD